MGFHNILIWPKSNDYVTYDNPVSYTHLRAHETTLLGVANDIISALDNDDICFLFV